MRFTNDALRPIKRFRMHNPSAQTAILFLPFSLSLSFSPSPFLPPPRLFASLRVPFVRSSRPVVSLMITRAINRYLGTSLKRRLSVASVHPSKQQGRGSLINERFRCGLPRTLIPAERVCASVIVNRSKRSSTV